MIIMKTKKRYIAPRVDVVTVLQESPLLDFSTETGSNVGEDIDGPGIGGYAKEHDSYSFWDEYDTDENKSLWH